MKLFKPLSVAATFALCGQLLAEVPKVENIRASQLDGTKFVEILYDVEDAENDKLTIRVEISADGGERYNVPARTFEGAVGANIDPGKDKKITWNAGLDWDGEFSDKMRVRITASDGKGLPGLEWSKEIPPGGFLMGQDGGPEGSGPSIHININYSYWLSKSWITVGQYVDFLNLAVASDLVTKLGKSTIGSFENIKFAPEYPQEREIDLVLLGSSHQIRWNVNKFEANESDALNEPALVCVLGAAAFANFYGFDIPLEVEWEKAMRGPDFDDAGEHTKYAWGNADKPKYSKFINKFGVSCYPPKELNMRNFHPNYLREITSSPGAINNSTKYDQMYQEMTTFSYKESYEFDEVGKAARSGSAPIYSRYYVGNSQRGIFRVIRRSKD